MNPVNSIMIEGNLVRDPEVGMTTNGKPFCRFSLAHNRSFKTEKEKEHQKEVSYFDIEVWAKNAEYCERFLEKGRGVRVVGRLKQDRWTDGEGQNRSKIKIVGEQVDFQFRSKSTQKDEGKEEMKEVVPSF